MEELTLKPRGERKLKPKWLNRRIEFESGKEQVQGITTTPQYMWELKYEGTAEMMEELESFFNRHCGGRKAFYWTDAKGVRHTVRFAVDELDITQKFGFTEQGYGVVAFECSVTLKKE